MSDANARGFPKQVRIGAWGAGDLRPGRAGGFDGRDGYACLDNRRKGVATPLYKGVTIP